MALKSPKALVKKENFFMFWTNGQIVTCSMYQMKYGCKK